VNLGETQTTVSRIMCQVFQSATVRPDHLSNDSVFLYVP